MKNAILAIAMILGTQTAFAGVGGASIICKSGTGKTKLEVYTSDAGEVGMTLTLKDKAGKDVKKSYINRSLGSAFDNSTELEKSYPNADIGPIVEIVERHVIAFTAVETTEDGDHAQALQLLSTAGSLKLKNGAFGEVKGTFNAVIRGMDPRKAMMDVYRDLQPIAVSCSYDYSI